MRIERRLLGRSTLIIACVPIAIAMWIDDRSDAQSPHPKASVPAFAKLMISVTPGKPGALTESIVAIRKEASCELHTLRTDEKGKVLQQEKASLTQKEFTAVWTIVEQQRLTTFKPRLQPGQVFDFGERRFRIEQKLKAEDKATVFDVRWDKPITNEKAIKTLTKQLTTLAKKCKFKMQLYYLR